MLQSTTLIENPSKSLSPSKQPFIDDLVFDMLRLPVKSLQRFRSACKPWITLISLDRKFAIEEPRRDFATRCDCRYIFVCVHSFPDEALTSYLTNYSLISAFSIDDGSDAYFYPNGAFTEGS
ncbi:hypothetical protein PIB30_013100 [Stylosanthes scabra]|uniref:F-box domain-containing protein n=1 Tax=Stylosanthes scabra TaxID=79078 RepID=A0ABU6V7Y2_9FABA|nr:hypothetical protein [Stylosanthes scabra]